MKHNKKLLIKSELQKTANKITEDEEFSRIEKEAIETENEANTTARASAKAGDALQNAEKLNGKS